MVNEIETTPPPTEEIITTTPPPEVTISTTPAPPIVETTPPPPVVRIPETFAAAFNPILISFEAPDVTKDIRIAVKIICGDGTERMVELERTPDTSGTVTFDLQALAQNVFVNSRTAATETTLGKDNELSGVLQVWKDFANITVQPDYTINVVNRVTQLGRNGSLHLGAVLYEGDIHLYDGLPIEVAVGNFDTVVGHVYTANIWSPGQRTQYSLPNGVHILPALHEGATQVTVQEASGFISSLKVVPRCTPVNPYFVRWVNRLGGWNYEMFEAREVTLKVSNRQNVQLYAYTTTDTQRTVSVNAERAISTGKDLLPRADFDVLCGIALSPLVQHWTGIHWETIVIDDNFSATWNSQSGYGTIEFVFRQPRILTQF